MSTPEKIERRREITRKSQSRRVEKDTFYSFTLFMNNIENMLSVIRVQMKMLDPDSPNFRQEFDPLAARSAALIKIMKIRDGVRNNDP